MILPLFLCFACHIEFIAEKLLLNDMNLRGSIPSEIFQRVTRLIEVSMYNNDFTGQLPSEIGLLKDCKVINHTAWLVLSLFHAEVDLTSIASSCISQAFLVNDNKFGGTLPKQLGLMVDLRWFHLSGNSIGGPISDLILTLKDLTELKLGSNSLTGTIPSDIGNLRRLELLHLESNKLSSIIPSGLGHLKYLKELRLYENSLEGDMPQEVCDLVTEEELKYLGADCTIKCDCCTKCF